MTRRFVGFALPRRRIDGYRQKQLAFVVIPNGFTAARAVERNDTSGKRPRVRDPEGLAKVPRSVQGCHAKHVLIAAKQLVECASDLMLVSDRQDTEHGQKQCGQGDQRISGTGRRRLGVPA